MGTLDSGGPLAYLKGRTPGLFPGRRKAPPMDDINEFIDSSVKSNDVFLFMKGTTDFPQ